MKNQRWVVPNTDSVEELHGLRLEAVKYLEFCEMQLAGFRGVDDQKHRAALVRKTDAARFVREVNATIKRMNLAAQRDMMASRRRRKA